MAEKCVFCRIAAGEIPTEFIAETDELMVFNDIHPSAPTHILIVPRKHVLGLPDTSDELWVKIKKMILKIVGEKKMAGFRVAVNHGEAAMIGHLHVHLLSGIKKDRKV